MVNNVQVSAAGSRWTAAGIYDATEGPHRLAFDLVEGAAAGLPARGRNPCAEGSTKIEFDGNVDALKINVLARLTEDGPYRQPRDDADMVRAQSMRNESYKAVAISVATNLDAAIGTKCGAHHNARC